MSDPIMTDSGIDWLEYMRGIENGNVVPTLEHLKAVCKAAREHHTRMVDCLEWLNRRGGLGYEAHAFIRDALDPLPRDSK